MTNGFHHFFIPDFFILSLRLMVRNDYFFFSAFLRKYTVKVVIIPQDSSQVMSAEVVIFISLFEYRR